MCRFAGREKNRQFTRQKPDGKRPGGFSRGLWGLAPQSIRSKSGSEKVLAKKASRGA